jgi:hypothetical protein
MSNPEIIAQVERAKTMAVAAAVILEQSKAALWHLHEQGRIIDTQIEHFHQLIARLEEVANGWEIQLKRVCDISHLDVQIQKLNAAILKEAAETKKDPWAGNS